MSWIDDIAWSAEGLLPVIAQDSRSGRVLMFAYMNREALERSISTGEAHYWSRSRAKLWRKGEESGHLQKIKGIFIDCDGDVILLKVDQVGGIACHTGRESCFFRRLDGEQWRLTDEVIVDPSVIYGSRELKGKS
ncbi:MAG: phosphoribosyl-AMP cyclohydrolase [Betaproteobacteria bacterium]|nr:phosphoribosyl-AMP cyclohydrolase [Betaproteobacteria bacterium]